MKFFTIILALFSSYMSFSQCNNFRQDYCNLPADWPYEYNSQSMSAGIFPGQAIRIKAILYQGNEYYLGFCLQDNLEGFHIKIFLDDHKIDANFSHQGNENIRHLNFDVQKTVTAIIEIKLDKTQVVNYTPSELKCLSIIIGNKETDETN